MYGNIHAKCDWFGWLVGWVGLVGAQAVPASLGVSASRDFDVNSLAVPRKAKESIGAIAKLSHKDGEVAVFALRPKPVLSETRLQFLSHSTLCYHQR